MLTHGSSGTGFAGSALPLPDDASDSASIASTDTLSHWTSSDDEDEPQSAEPQPEPQSLLDAGEAPLQGRLCKLQGSAHAASLAASDI